MNEEVKLIIDAEFIQKIISLFGTNRAQQVIEQILQKAGIE